MAMIYNYRPLPPKFRQGGFNFEQLMRQGDVILLRKWKTENPAILDYEVVVVRKVERRIAFGKEYPPSEMMPSNEHWGTSGWSPNTLAATKSKFDSVVEKSKAARQPRILYTAEEVWILKPDASEVPALETESL